MDIQNNSLIITYLNPINNSEISTNNINLNLLDDSEDLLFTFNEYTKVILKLKSNNKNSFIKTLNIYNNNYLVSNDKLEITSGVENKKYLPPGVYPIFIDLGFKKINTKFKVIPNTLELKDYDEILSYLENKEKNITKVSKINKEDKITLFKNTNNEKYNLNYLIENENKIINAINLVVRNLKEEDSIVVKNKLDKKVINNMLKKGISITDFNSLDKTNIIKKNNNISINESIRYILDNIYKLVCESRNSIEKEIESIEKNLVEKEIELTNLRRKLDLAEDNIYLSKNTKTSKKTNFMLSKTYILKTRKKISKLKDLYNKLSNYETYLYNQINNSWLKNIKPNDQINFKNKNIYYNNLQQIYRNLYKSESNLDITKPTSIIYETYSLLKIISILEKLDFRIENTEENSICLIKGEYKIILDINKEISKELEDINNSQFISINSKHCTPDIKLTLFKNDNIIKSLIFEVKCRKQRYLYSNQGDTTVIEQSKDYLSFAYYDSKTQTLNKDIIDEIIILYPIQNIEYEYFSFLNISFCQLGESKETNLNEKIENFLNKNLN